MLANGVDTAGLADSDAATIARILEATGRTIPESKYVDAVSAEDEDAAHLSHMAG